MTTVRVRHRSGLRSTRSKASPLPGDDAFQEDVAPSWFASLKICEVYGVANGGQFSLLSAYCFVDLSTAR